ncbi:endothiapepsin [Plectosphaerella plurivora]|uniref:Endothiapepsin n=1 Tax=Plectosphaerella plurivora TaxID=936078 RepID=A0A9P8VL61_9PEZI|nr:endothiapepsin [Plectosphaerella plurivora]
MHNFGTFLVSLLAATGYAAVVPKIGVPEQETGTFSVRALPNPGFQHRNGAIALAKAYHKFGKEAPVDVAQAAGNATAARLTKRTTGSATTTPEDSDVEYLTPVQIGTPAQTLNLDFDTGSSDLWVFSTETPSSQVNGQTRYNPASSSTSTKVSGSTWSISYGDGSSSSGDVYTDKVTIGGLTVAKQAVEAAQKVSASFTSDPLDGLLGLAFSTINTVKPTKQKTFFDNAKASLNAPLFTADLKHAAPGKYNFGYIDTAAYKGSITYTDVDSSDGFWSFTSTGYQVGSAAFKSSAVSGIADTGTTLLLLPTAVVTAYYAQVSGSRYDSTQGGYVFSCSATLPAFTFGVESARITIPGSYINFAPANNAGTLCFGGIQRNTNIGFSIFGDVALKAAFVVFNGGDQTLGWASK